VLVGIRPDALRPVRGEELPLEVDTDRLLLFREDGARITPPRR
jgi:hypothetical protein